MVGGSNSVVQSDVGSEHSGMLVWGGGDNGGVDGGDEKGGAGGDEKEGAGGDEKGGAGKCIEVSSGMGGANTVRREGVKGGEWRRGG